MTMKEKLALHREIEESNKAKFQAWNDNLRAGKGVKTLKYLREWKDGSGAEELTKDGAIQHIKKWYPNMEDDVIESILSKPGFSLNCMFSYLTVEE